MVWRRYADPRTFIGIKNIKVLKISDIMFDKSENTGIDWFSEWPTLEAVIVYDSETGPLSKKSMSAPM